MAKFEHLPNSDIRFRKFSKLMQANRPRVKAMFNRYVWRYRLASAFTGITAAEEVGEKTLRGYAEAMRLFLAYSAYDEIRSAEYAMESETGGKLKWHECKNNPSLAKRIRSNDNLKVFLLNAENVFDPYLRGKLKKFYAGGTDDVMLVASSMRNAFAHGDYTAASGGLTNAAKRKVIHDLSLIVLAKAEEIATKILDQFFLEIQKKESIAVAKTAKKAAKIVNARPIIRLNRKSKLE